MELSEGGQGVRAGLAQQRLGEGSPGLRPTPASRNRENVVPSPGFGPGQQRAHWGTEKGPRPAQLPGEEEGGPGASGTCFMASPRNSLAVQGSSPGSERCRPQGPSPASAPSGVTNGSFP